MKDNTDVEMTQKEIAKLNVDLEQAFFRMMIIHEKNNYYKSISAINQISATIVEKINLIMQIKNTNNGEQESV